MVYRKGICITNCKDILFLCMLFIIYIIIYIYYIINILHNKFHYKFNGIIRLTKITIAQNEVVLSCYRVRELYFLVVIFEPTICVPLFVDDVANSLKAMFFSFPLSVFIPINHNCRSAYFFLIISFRL